MRRTIFFPALFAACALFAQSLFAQATPPTTDNGEEQYPTAGAFLTLVVGDSNDVLNALAWVKANWEPGMVPMALESIRLMRDPVGRITLLETIEEKTSQSFGVDIRAWQTWWWNQDTKPSRGYATFKETLYGLIDPKFKNYFGEKLPATIRLDEAIWGGVRQDGIPPLRNPVMISASEAEYLEDSNVVFGISLSGDARAYPKRILAWHEMFVDKVGGKEVAGVYCTLCGTVILYFTELNGVNHEIGTSGFLYRSNKLMYDKATQSLWSTMRGTPVIGELVGKGIRLKRGAVVTTTWGEWRRRHPETQVLSVSTGHQRDYGEGAAYASYFATDELMFSVPKVDARLANKAEVLVLRRLDGSDPLAIDSDYLSANPVHHDKVGDQAFVVLTDKSGANRAFNAGSPKIIAFDGDATATDENGGQWTVTEAALTMDGSEPRARVPANRAFWFGWYAAFPDSRLVK